MLDVRDALTWIREGTPLHARFVRVVPHLPATATSDEVLAAMRGMGVQMAVVMDEHGGTDGIITLADLLEESSSLLQIEAAGNAAAGFPPTRPPHRVRPHAGLRAQGE